jgi:hypothetical protein
MILILVFQLKGMFLVDSLRFDTLRTQRYYIIPPKDYTFSPGDIVLVRLSGNLPLEYTTVVDYNGRIPLYSPTGKILFEIKISDMSYDSVLTYLNRTISPSLKGYNVSLFLVSPSVFPVRFEGEVFGHSEIYVNGLTRLHEILKFVPLKPNASRDIFEITLNHKRDTVNLLPLYRDGDIYSSPLLKPNSVIKIFPDSSFCWVLFGGISQVNCREGEDILTVFRRATFADPKVKPVDIKVRRGKFKDKLDVGDTLVPIFGFDSVIVSGYVNKPSSIPYISMATVSYYISQAGGFKDNVVLGKYTVIGLDGKVKKVKEDYVPLPGEVIFVEKSNLRDYLLFASTVLGMAISLLNTYLILTTR